MHCNVSKQLVVNRALRNARHRSCSLPLKDRPGVSRAGEKYSEASKSVLGSCVCVSVYVWVCTLIHTPETTVHDSNYHYSVTSVIFSGGHPFGRKDTKERTCHSTTGH